MKGICKVLIVLLLLVTSVSARTIIIFEWEGDSAAVRGFREGILDAFPDARFYTFGTNRDLKLFALQLSHAENIPSHMYFADSFEVTRELLRKLPGRPVAFTMNNDPVQQGLVASASSPEVPAVGVSMKIPILEQLKTLRKITAFSTLGVLKVHNDAGYEFSLSELKRLSRFFGYTVHEYAVNDISAFRQALHQQKPDAVYIPAAQHPGVQVYEELEHHQIPTIAENADEVRKGGALLALVTDQFRAGRFAAQQAVKVLRGTSPYKPGILTTEHFMVVVNLAKAQKINVQIPLPLLIIADDIIR